MPKKILVIEDEAAISMALKDELEFGGYLVEVSEDGQSGLQAISASTPDLIILDLMLPGVNGLEICRHVRGKGWQVPIIMLTARSEEIDKVRGLDLGADDYITKPFSLSEVMARVRAVLRRVQPETEETAGRLEVGELQMDLKRHELFRAGEAVQLTQKEFQLLRLLLSRPGEVISRDEFLDRVWGEEVHITHRTVDTHVASLRKKIERDPERPRYISSVRGAGYKLNEKPADS